MSYPPHCSPAKAVRLCRDRKLPLVLAIVGMAAVASTILPDWRRLVAPLRRPAKARHTFEGDSHPPRLHPDTRLCQSAGLSRRKLNRVLCIAFVDSNG